MDPITDILQQDPDPSETREWVESIDAILERGGAPRAHFLLERMVDETRRAGGMLPFAPTTEYINSIPPEREAKSPGDAALEWRIRSIIRWNAMAMVLRANRKPGELGGHIASFASSATLYDVGFNHFWRAQSADHPGDLVCFQGHSSPGIYARAFLEGRIDGERLDHFRMETGGQGLPSYPHPWLLPDFWQLPTVSMGLGPIQAIYQAQFQKYLEHRGLVPKTDRKVWCFLGDGETDEPESLGAIGLAGREHLDNLIFVINCNLQRLDGPVRGNGKIIQELEGQFRGAGWNVLKLIWGSYWDPLLARDKDGLLKRLMMETVDGEYQAYKAFGGAYTREHFFGKYPETKAMVASLSDEDIWRLNRGGHDPHKVYAAYHAAMHTEGMPTVILAKTVKGYGMGDAGESQNITHQQKKMDTAAVRALSATASIFRWPTPSSRRCRTTTPVRIRPRCSICARVARRWAVRCPAAGARPTTRPSRPGWMRSSRSPRAPASARSAPPWPSCAASIFCCATRTSDRASCRSWPTRRAPSAWRACSARSASTRRSARSTGRRMPTS